jgi:tetratricopeptide (TPR) repeat protein
MWYFHQVFAGIGPMFRLWRLNTGASNAATEQLGSENLSDDNNYVGPRQSASWSRRVIYILVISAALMIAAIGINARSSFFTRLGRTPSQPMVIRPSVAVLGFSGSSGAAEAAVLSDALTEMFRTEMSAGGKLRLISGEDVAQMKRDLPSFVTRTLSKSSLELIRKNTGVDYILVGFGPRIEGSDLRFDVEVEDTRTGEIVASAAQTGPQATLFSLVSKAGALLREKMGVHLEASKDAGPLRASLPASDDARQLYLEGISHLRAFDAPVAQEILVRAAALDPGSPLIQAALVEAWSALGYEKNAMEAAQKGLRLATALSPEESSSLRGRYCELARDWGGAVNTYRSLWTIYGDNLGYGIHLALAQSAAGRIDEAFSTISEMRRLPSPLGEDPRIDLTEAAIAERKGDFKREQKAAGAAASKAEERGARLLFADARLRECWALNALGDRKRALEYAELARGTFAKMGDRGGQARALKNIADVMDDIPDHQQAKAFYDSAVNMFRQIGNENGVAVTLNNLGYTLRDLGELAKARQSFEESARISRETGNDNLQARALNGLAGVNWRQGDLIEASLIYQQAYEVFMGTGDQINAATVSGNIAIIFQQIGSLEKAQRKFEESLQIIRNLGDKDGEARTLGNLGELLLLKGDLEHAKKRFEEQLSIGENGDQKQSAYALVGLGEVLAAHGDLGEARNRLEKAIALRVKNGEVGLAAEARVPLGEVLLEQGELTAAESLAREAVRQFQKENEADDKASATALMAGCLAAQGKSQEARSAIESAMKEASESKNRATKLDVSLKYARIHAADAPSGKVVGIVKSALEDAERHGFVGYELEARLLLTELEERHGDSRVGIHLRALQNEAAAHGFGLIERKAAKISTRIH